MTRTLERQFGAEEEVGVAVRGRTQQDILLTELNDSEKISLCSNLEAV